MKEGYEIAGRFKCTIPLGRGGMGEVWKSWDSVLCRWVAIKFVPKHEWRHEDKTVASLSHPNIAAVYDTGTVDDLHYVAMQYVDGKHLERPIQALRLAAVIRDAALAVQYAHENGVIHRDLKPDNIMLDKSGRVYVTDFGLSSPAGYIMDEIVGTAEYISPSQAAGKAPSVQDDIYSLGATLQRMLPAKAPKELVRIAASCIFGAYASMSDLAGALDRFLHRRRLRKWLVGIVAALVVACIGGGLVIYGVERHKAAQVESAEGWCRIGERAIATNDDAVAVDAFTKALALNPAYRTYLFRSFAYWRLCRYDDAVADLNTAIEVDPSNPAAHRTLKDVLGSRAYGATRR